MVGAWQAGFYEDDEGYWLLIDEYGTYQLTTENRTLIEKGGIRVEGGIAHFFAEGGSSPQSFPWEVSEIDLYGYPLIQLTLGGRAWTKE